MTQIFRVRPRHAPGRPPARGFARAGLVGALALALAASGTAAAAATTTPTPTPTPTASGVVEFTLAPVGGGVVPAGETLALSLVIENGTGITTPAATATVSLGSTPFDDRSALAAWLDGSSKERVSAVASTTLDAVEPGAQHTTGVSVSADDPALADLEPGVYPVSASYPTGSGTVTSTSALVVPDPDVQDAPVGIIVPITAGARTDALLSAEELAELTGPGGSLNDQLDGVASTDVILAIDPAIVASIRALGSRAPESAVSWLAAVDGLPNERFALQYGDADVAVQLETGLSRPLRATSFEGFLDVDDFDDIEPTPTPTPSPTPTTAEGDEVDTVSVPTPDELRSVSGARDQVYWPAQGTATPDVVSTLAGLGTDDETPVTVLASTGLTAGADSSTVTAHAAAGDADVVVYDAAVSAALYDASLEDTAARGASLAAASAHLAFAVADADGAPIAVSIDRGADRSSVAIRSTLTAVSDYPGVVPISLDGITAVDAVAVDVADLPDPTARVDAVASLLADQEDLTRFATVLDTPALLTGPERLELLQLLGVAWVGDETWPTVVAEHRTSTAQTLDSVGLQPTPAMDLYGSAAGLRFWVRNDLPYPVNLVLYTTPDDLRLDVQRATDVVATAQSNTRVEVPVQARLGNGDVTLTLQLRSPASVAIGDPIDVDVSVRAEWEAVGIWVLSILVGGLLVLGVARTVVKARRRRAGKTDTAAASPDADASDAPVDQEDAR